MMRRNNLGVSSWIQFILLFLLWNLLLLNAPIFAQAPSYPTYREGMKPGLSSGGQSGLPTEPFPFLTKVTAVPGDTFVDLKWTPFWEEDLRKPSRGREAQKTLEKRIDELLPPRGPGMIPAPGLRATKPEEQGRSKEDMEKVLQKIPEGKEIAGYIIHFGKDSKNYSQKIDAGPVSQYRLRGLSNYSTYFFALQAYTRTREMSEISQEISATPKEEKDLLSSIERGFAEEAIPQTVPREIKQFGYDFFQSKDGSLALIPDVPVGSDYIIGPGDSFTITLWGRIEASFPVEVDRNGEISLPKVGVLKVWGLTFSQLQKFLYEQIARYYKDFQLNVTMERLRTIRVFVVGEAQWPGTYLLSSLATVYHGLIAAGGPSKKGSMRNIQLRRNGKVIETIDLYDFFTMGDRSRDVRLQSGDTIFIPIIGTIVGVSGSVKRPAIYELKEALDINECLKMAGGITFQGYLQKVQVERVEAHQKKVVVDFDLSPEGKAPPGLLSTVLRDGDFIKVFPIYSQTENIVFLEGHVKKPGSFELKPGMKVSNLIPGFEALLPEPYLERAEIYRQVPPDRKPQILSFSLQKLLQGDEANNLALMNQDRVIIYSQANLKEEPRVSITGEVQSPGRYRLTENMRVKDLIYQAGNVRRSAFLSEAEITRLIKTGKEVTPRLIYINLNEALREDPSHNIPLEEDDQLFVRQIPKWYVDKRVSIGGEVRFPGVYTFHKGERLSSVLERAGGFASEAYLPAAFFTRESVRKVQEKRIQEFIEEQQQELVKEGARLMEAALSKEEADQRQKVLAQKKEIVARLKAATVTGRIVIKLTSLDKFKGSEYDVELEEDDALLVPPKPSSVMVMGRVYNPNAIIYMKDKPLKYYLSKVGGPAENADEKRIYLVQADGSVVSRTQERLFGFRWDPETSRWASAGFMETSVGPGDTILVPEKYERIYWARELKDWTQILFQIAVAAGVLAALY